jgi:putative glutamine amidotransferase
MTPPSPTGRGFVALNGSDFSGAPVPARRERAVDTSAKPAHRPGSSAPVIGLTTYLQRAQTGVWDTRAAYLPHVYFDAVTRAGGIAVLLPPQPVDDRIAARVLDGLDGLIVTGGRDVDSTRYGQAPHPETDRPGIDRDDWELALLTGAIAREIPFLGICRGAQVLNVALGGTLHQHLPDVIGSSKYQLGNAEFAKVEVLIDEASAVGRMVGGDDLTVEVYHHQAIDVVAPGLRVTARSQDDVIEAVELESVPFGVGVQWHPEQTPEDLRLFAGLVEAAVDYRKTMA